MGDIKCQKMQTWQQRIIWYQKLKLETKFSYTQKAAKNGVGPLLENRPYTCDNEFYIHHEWTQKQLNRSNRKLDELV